MIAVDVNDRDPADHDHYLKEVWLTKEYPEFSGVALLGFYDLAGQGERAQFRFLRNPEAAHPLPDGFFNDQETDFKDWDVEEGSGDVSLQRDE